MTSWIEVASGSLPPSCLSVYLYIVHLYDDEESLCDEFIITGFYDDEKNKWAYDFVNENGYDWTFFNESKTVKVIAWTLLPPLFDYEKYKNDRKKYNLNLFIGIENK